LVSTRAQKALAHDTIEKLAIKADSPGQPVGQLSGGNQQKVVLGRWLQRAPQGLLLDEPTRGVAIDARSEIRRLIRRRAAAGTAATSRRWCSADGCSAPRRSCCWTSRLAGSISMRAARSTS